MTPRRRSCIRKDGPAPFYFCLGVKIACFMELFLL